eukprot:CAMPEP_0175786406 /NCGR_PEP_ID=MMETSP0097-20121207/79823_1 /TAXON_ID=311494 /ORGANISM="Alexandrium monilatum, Strain CCMP3105" /LENGTH=33 /DNA_ID= /DNA_START= /DNA_END= /DNA_ORIENTATION=
MVTRNPLRTLELRLCSMPSVMEVSSPTPRLELR